MSDDKELFELAMETLGTKRTSRAEQRPSKPRPDGVTVTEDMDFDAVMRSAAGPAKEIASAKPSSAVPQIAAPSAAPAPIVRTRYSVSAREAQEFAEAMRDLGAPPPDRLDPTPPSSTRDDLADLARLLKRGEIDSEAVLDLHGKTLKEARPKLAAFIKEARAEGWQLVTIIVGRGHHSDRGEAVLRPAVEQWLRDEHRGDVREVLAAPPHMGGSGAWVAAIRITGTK